MSIIKPTFPDGVVVKVDDLQRTLDYTRAIEQGILRYFGTGIIYGTAISYTYTAGIAPNPNTIAVTVTGPTLISAENKELISLDAGQTVTGTFVYPTGTTGVDIYIYESAIVTNTTRQNLANVPRPVSELSVYSLSDVLPTPTTAGKRAKIATIINPNAPTTYKSMLTLQHTDTFLDGVYTGPILNADAALANLSITTAKLADGAVTSDKIADGAVTSDKIADGSILANHLTSTQPIIGTSNIIDSSITTSKIVDGAVTLEKIDFSTGLPTTVDLPATYILPTQRYSTPQNYGTPAYLWDFGQVDPLSPLNFRFSGLNSWAFSNNSSAPSYLPTWPSGSTMASSTARAAHLRWLQGIGAYSWSQLGSSYTHPFGPGSTDDLVWTGGTLGNILFNTSAITFPALYIIGITEDSEALGEGGSGAAWLPHALKISSVIPHSIGLPQHLTVRGVVPTRCFITSLGDYIPVHTPFIIPPDGYRISSISFSSQHNINYTDANSYLSVLEYIQQTSSPRGFHTTWDAPLPLHATSGNPLGGPYATVRGMCTKCLSLLHAQYVTTIYNRFTEEALMMSIDVALEKIDPAWLNNFSTNLPVLLKEPRTGVYVWKSNI